MMQTAAAGFSAYELAGLRGVVSSVVADANGGVEVTFLTNEGGRTYDPARGAVAYEESATTLTGWVGPIELRELAAGQVGDTRILIRCADLATAPATDSRLRASGVDYRITAVTRGPLESHWVIYAQRLQ